MESPIRSSENQTVVFNQDKKTLVKIDPERRHIALSLHQRALTSRMEHCAIIYLMREHSLFRHLGFESFNEYVEIGLGISLRRARELTQVGQHVLDDMGGKSEDPTRRLTAVMSRETSYLDRIEALSDFNPTKIVTLLSHGGAALTALQSEGRLVFNDGSSITREEIEQLSVAKTREFVRDWNAEKREMSNLISQQKETISLLKSESKEDAKLREENQDLREELDHYKKNFGSEKLTFQQKKSELTELLHNLMNGCGTIYRCPLDLDSHEVLQSLALRCEGELERLREKLTREYLEIRMANQDRLNVQDYFDNSETGDGSVEETEFEDVAGAKE